MFGGLIDFEQVRALFRDEQACIRVLYEARWPDGFRCPRCACPHAYTISTRRLPLFECAHCQKQTSLTVGTIFERTRTPLHLWFQAIYLHCRPEGINARQLSEAIGVTYKTAWLMAHKLRHAMSRAEAERLLEGIVRVANTTIYYHLDGISAWQPQEQPVLIAAAGEVGEPERIKIEKQDKSVLPNRKAPPAPESFILRHVAPEARGDVVVTRRKDRPRELLDVGVKLEQWLAWIFRGIGPKHLQRYLNHFCYWWNERNGSMFADLLQWCAATPTITYPALTGRAPRASRPVRTAERAARAAAG